MIYYGNNDYRDYLAHHGVLGMHWGIRRYQPYSVKPRKSGKGGKEIGEAREPGTDKKHIVEQKEYVSNLSKELNSEWDYGVLLDGKKITEEQLSNFDWKKYRTIPLDTLYKQKIGVCWDFVNYQHDRLKQAGIPDESWLLIMDLSSKETPDRIITHTFTTFTLDDKMYWLESSLWSDRGVHEISSPEEVFKKVANNYTSEKKPYSVFKYNPEGMDKGLTDQEFFDKATEDNWVADYNEEELDKDKQ